MVTPVSPRSYLLQEVPSQLRTPVHVSDILEDLQIRGPSETGLVGPASRHITSRLAVRETRLWWQRSLLRGRGPFVGLATKPASGGIYNRTGTVGESVNPKRHIPWATSVASTDLDFRCARQATAASLEQNEGRGDITICETRKRNAHRGSHAALPGNPGWSGSISTPARMPRTGCAGCTRSW